ncbi:hypothetical protein N5O83_22295 [Ectopseudomonas oleovorans]|nr:hypothetical protein [Pseudomonas oleovorans]WGG23321.1 hypothetical protein N5O83_22295 [Pseudomonas oleovorans]
MLTRLPTQRASEVAELLPHRWRAAKCARCSRHTCRTCTELTATTDCMTTNCSTGSRRAALFACSNDLQQGTGSGVSVLRLSVQARTVW